MKQARVQVGGEFYTKVSGKATLVRILSKGGEKGRCYRVKRADTGKQLDQLRAATALHDTEGPW